MPDPMIPTGAVEVARVEVVMFVDDDGDEQFAVRGSEFGTEGMAVYKQLGMLAQAMTLTGSGACRLAEGEL